VFWASSVGAAGAENPRITAQGFDISVIQEGMLHDFGQLRVRFEVPRGIEELYVKERSYEVDLAKTPEATHFALFDLKTQVRRLADVTLNFENYINRKIDSDGDYVVELRVTDRGGNSVFSRLDLRVKSPITTSEKPESKIVGVDQFVFQRVGRSEPTGTDRFCITWKTVDSDDVTIEISGDDKSSCQLVEIIPSNYATVETQGHLDQAVSLGEEVPLLHLSAANGKAAGSVFGVINKDKRYLLKVTGSEATVSTIGTTVILTGEYKH
jgi:hypothetical protein